MNGKTDKFVNKMAFDVQKAPMAKNNTTQESNRSNRSIEWIISELQSRKIEYSDKRDLGGCLWIVGNRSLEEFTKECLSQGYHFRFKIDGCKGFPMTTLSLELSGDEAKSEALNDALNKA